VLSSSLPKLSSANSSLIQPSLVIPRSSIIDDNGAINNDDFDDDVDDVNKDNTNKSKSLPSNKEIKQTNFTYDVKLYLLKLVKKYDLHHKDKMNQLKWNEVYDKMKTLFPSDIVSAKNIEKRGRCFYNKFKNILHERHQYMSEGNFFIYVFI
jgi:hypothetical protein